VLGRIFGPKKEVVAGSWRELHNEELHNLCASLNIITVIKSRRIRWAGKVARMGKDEECIKMLVGIYEGKRPLERTKRRWKI